MRRTMPMMLLVLAAALSAASAVGAPRSPERTPDGSASPASGRALALSRCGDCHIVVPGQSVGEGLPGPDLVARMQDPGVTELALRSYLRTSHPIMPNIRLNREETDDIVAWLLSLKEDRR